MKVYFYSDNLLKKKINLNFCVILIIQKLNYVVKIIIFGENEFGK